MLGEDPPEPTSKVDVYAFGLMLWEILAGKRMWKRGTDVAGIISTAVSSNRPEIPSSVRSFLADVISRSWKRDPKDRPSFDEVFQIFEAHDFEFYDHLNLSDLRAYADRITSVDDQPGATTISSALPAPPPRDVELWKTKCQAADLYHRGAKLGYCDAGIYCSGTRKSDGSEWVLWFCHSWQVGGSEYSERLSDWVNMRHPHVAQIVAILAPKAEDQALTIVFEPVFCCTLEDLLRDKNGRHSGLWTNIIRIRIILGVALAMEYLHSQEIAHGHFSPETVILKDSGAPLVTDLAYTVPHAQGSGGSPASSTIAYMSPETFDAQVFTEASDVYSFGVLLFEVVTGMRFKQGLKISSVCAAVKAVQAGKRPPIPASIHPKIRDIITKCWHPYPGSRPPVAGVLAGLAEAGYPFFADVPASVAIEFVAGVRSEMAAPSVSAAPNSGPVPALASPRANRPAPRPSAPAADAASGTADASSDRFRKMMAEISPSEMDFSRHTWVKDLGRGAFGLVRLMRDDASGREIAVKVIPTSLDFNPDRFLREVGCLALKHPCLLGLVGYALPAAGLDASAKIGTEYLPNGSLDIVITRSLQNNPPPFWTSTGKSIILVGIALGLQFLHSKHIIHRDLKPGNVLLDEKGYPRIADFGSVRSTLVPGAWSTAPSTPAYRAPEQVDDDDLHTTKIDVYSYGLILFEVLAERPVFPSTLNAFQIGSQSMKNAMRPAVPAMVHPSIRRVIQRSWSAEPGDRPDINEILKVFEENNYPFYPDGDVRAVKQYVERMRSNASPTPAAPKK
jgi:serine/threonine protein kinase